MDQAEVHVQICGDQERSKAALHLVEADAEQRSIWFFDRQNLALYDSGVILRATRKHHDDSYKMDVKLRPIASASISGRWWAEDGFSCEWDTYAMRNVESCRLRDEGDASALLRVVNGSRAPQVLVTTRQSELLGEVKYFDLNAYTLRPFGPARVQIWDLGTFAGIDDVQVEFWQAGRSLVMTEVSVKVDLDIAPNVSGALRRQVTDLGLTLCTDDMAKTRQVLESFQ